MLDRRPASVPVSGSVFGARVGVGVGGLRERARARIAVRAFRVPHTNSLTLTPTRPAPRVPALRVARNFPTGSSYFCFSASAFFASAERLYPKMLGASSAR